MKGANTDTNTNAGYFPYLRIWKMNEILGKVPLQYVSEVNDFSTRDIAAVIGESTTTVNNLISTLKSLDFVTGQRRFWFTRPGADYTVLIRTEEAAAKEILKEQMERKEYFGVVKARLIQKGELTIFEIGEEIMRRYGKNWTNPLTLKTYGAAIASILDFTGFGYYRGGILRLEEDKEEMNLPVPYLSVEKMVKILNALFPAGCEIHTLADELGTKDRRLSQELACCCALGLVRHSRRGFYELTEGGREIARSSGSDGVMREKFTEHLLSSGYKRLIDKLQGANEITMTMLGDLLEEEYHKDWSEITKRTYGKKFLNWLRYSGIVMKGEHERVYRYRRNVHSRLNQT